MKSSHFSILSEMDAFSYKIYIYFLIDKHIFKYQEILYKAFGKHFLFLIVLKNSAIYIFTLKNSKRYIFTLCFIFPFQSYYFKLALSFV